MSVSIIKKPATPASNAEGYVVVLPVRDIPAGYWAASPVEFNVHRAIALDGTDVQLVGELLGFGEPTALATVTLPAGRALAFAE